VAAGRTIGSIADADGANASTLIPAVDRGYTVNGDGSVTQFVLSTLQTVKRIKLGDDADSAVYDPATGQLAVMMAEDRAVVFLDAKSGDRRGSLKMPSAKLEATAVDGQGRIFIAERDRNAVAVVDAKARTLVAEWPIAGCQQPTGLAYDAGHKRLFAGCRGNDPVLGIIADGDGRAVATVPIGRGNDGVIYDADTTSIFTSNGVDANLVVVRQLDADTYALAEAVMTRPSARTMAMNPKTKAIYLVTAEGAVDPAKPVNTGPSRFYPNVFFPDTLTVLTYAPR
jgi:hypothetical protein